MNSRTLTLLVGHYSVAWLDALHSWVVRDLQGNALDYRDSLHDAVATAVGRANLEGEAYGVH